MSYTPVETQTPDEIPTLKSCLDIPADVADEEELPEQLSDWQNERDSLDDDPTWSSEELENSYKAMKDDDDNDSPSTNENPRYMPYKTLNTSNILHNISLVIVAFQCNY